MEHFLIVWVIPFVIAVGVPLVGYLIGLQRGGPEARKYLRQALIVWWVTAAVLWWLWGAWGQNWAINTLLAASLPFAFFLGWFGRFAVRKYGTDVAKAKQAESEGHRRKISGAAMCILLPAFLGAAIWGFFYYAVVAWLLAEWLCSLLVRDLEPALTRELHAEWGGHPAAIMLSFARGQELDIREQQEIRERLRRLLPGLSLPSSKLEELESEAAARAAYDDCVQYLEARAQEPAMLRHIRGAQLVMVMSVTMYAHRMLALLIALVGAAACVAYLVFTLSQDRQPSALAIGVTAVSMLMLIASATRSRTRLRQRADRYARSLLELSKKLAALGANDPEGDEQHRIAP